MTKKGPAKNAAPVKLRLEDYPRDAYSAFWELADALDEQATAAMAERLGIPVESKHATIYSPTDVVARIYRRPSGALLADRVFAANTREKAKLAAAAWVAEQMAGFQTTEEI